MSADCATQWHASERAPLCMSARLLVVPYSPNGAWDTAANAVLRLSQVQLLLPSVWQGELCGKSSLTIHKHKLDPKVPAIGIRIPSPSRRHLQLEITPQGHTMKSWFPLNKKHKKGGNRSAELKASNPKSSEQSQEAEGFIRRRRERKEHDTEEAQVPCTSLVLPGLEGQRPPEPRLLTTATTPGRQKPCEQMFSSLRDYTHSARWHQCCKQMQ